MDDSRRKAMRRAHAKHADYCTCGRVVHGNGGSYNHAAMHRRAGDGHYYMTYTAWRDRELAAIPSPTDPSQPMKGASR